MRNKLFTLILCILLSVFLVPVYAVASGGQFISPEDGSEVLAAEIDSICADILSFSEKAVFLIDGEEIAVLEDVSGEVAVPLEIPLTLGKHKAEVILINGAVAEKIESVFSAVEKQENLQYSNSFTAGKDSIGKMSIAAPTFGSISSDEGEDTPVTLSLTSFEGKEGSGDWAVGYISPDGVDVPANKKAQPFVGFSDTASWTETVILECDMKMFTTNEFHFETKNSSGGWSKLHGMTLFTDDGYINTTDKEYPVGQWFKFKNIIDFKNLKGQVYINDDLVLEAEQPEAIRNITTVRYMLTMGTLDAGQGFAIDNFSVTLETPIQGMEYSGSETSSGEWVSGDTISAGAKKVTFMSQNALKSGDVTEYVSAFENGLKKKIKSANSSVEDGTIEVEFLNAAVEKSEIKFVFSKNIFSGEKLPGADLFTSVSVAEGSQVVKNVAFKADGNSVLSKHQISGASTVGAEISFSNEENTGKTVIVALCAYQGDKLAAITVTPVTIDALGEKTEPIEIIVPSRGEYKIECTIFTDFVNKEVISKLWEI